MDKYQCNFFIEKYKNAHRKFLQNLDHQDDAFHDSAIPHHIMELFRQEFTRYGVNYKKIKIVATPDADFLAGTYSNEFLINTTSKLMYDSHLAHQTIVHEIGHFLEGHSMEKLIFSKRDMPKELYDSLVENQELFADLLLAFYNPETATHINYLFKQEVIMRRSRRYPYTNSATLASYTERILAAHNWDKLSNYNKLSYYILKIVGIR